jgi:UDP-glucuronate 4-epimerase
MTILVTGGAGFIGSHFIELLLKKGHDSIVCVDNFNDYYDPALKRNNITSFSDSESVTLIEGDFCDPAFSLDLFKRYQFDKVVHLGAYAGVRISVSQPLVYMQNNVSGTLCLLEAARAFPVENFLLASSSTVYGKGAEIPFKETNTLGIPASPYGASKRGAELIGMTYYELHGIPFTAVRPFSVYGPRLRPDLALTIFTDRIIHEQEVPLYGDGSYRRDFTHVTDICDGIYAAMNSKEAIGHRINLGHGHPITMSHVIETLEESIGKKANINYLPVREEDLETTFADIELARNLLGYNPKITFSEGASDFVSWYREWNKV